MLDSALQGFVLLVLAGAIAGVAFYAGLRAGRARAERTDPYHSTLFAGLSPASGPATGRDFDHDRDGAEGFRPTQVMSYADRMRANPAEAAVAGRADPLVSAAVPALPVVPVQAMPAAAAGALRDVRALLRVRMRTGTGVAGRGPGAVGGPAAGSACRFATIEVIGFAVAAGERTVYARSPGAAAVGPIVADQIETAVDLEGRARIDDLWSWLERRADAAEPEVAPAVAVRRSESAAPLPGAAGSGRSGPPTLIRPDVVPA
ncbi:MAG: hypothetical protein AB7G13_01510 [Lautropia sp.]